MPELTKLPKFDVLASNAKLDKGAKLKYLQLGLSLAPADMSGRNVCPHASEGCKAACLFTAGRGKMKNVSEARIRRTNELFADRAGYLRRIHSDIMIAKAWCQVNGWKLAIRLNVISDLVWEGRKFLLDGKTLFETHKDVQFLDYTKNPTRAMKWAKGQMPANYHLTFSHSEVNGKDCEKVLRAGGNVAMVFKPTDKKALKRSFELPSDWNGARVVSGEETDLRFLDPKGCVVGLRAKGDAWKDESGFVVEFS